MQVSIRRSAVALMGAVGLLIGAVATASADTRTSTSTAGSITAWTLGGTYYKNSHTSDDFGLDVLSGIAIDARWASCSASGGTGAIKYNITASEGRRVLGTDFLAGSCVRVHYRGYSQTGTFSSTQHWNYNFA